MLDLQTRFPFSLPCLSCSIRSDPPRVPPGERCMKVLLSADDIQRRVAEMAQQIAADYHGRDVTIVGVLTGCLMFLADLVRHLDLPLRIFLLQASSYRGATTTPGALRVQPE